MTKKYIEEILIMRKYVKPEFYIENFELTQTVATACAHKIPLKPSQPGGSVTYTLTCNKSGNGHWDHYDVEVKDNNPMDGKIGKEEWVAAYETAENVAAKNGVITGPGHRNHTDGSFTDLFNS